MAGAIRTGRFAGHSLGGALAPTLALDLATQDGFDVTKWANVMVYPSAGPTPGNQLCSDLFAETFPQRQQAGTDAWNVWNMDVVNSLDIVPRCWSELATLPSLYPAVGSQEQANVQAIVTSLTAKNDLTTNVYATLPASMFAGTYNPSPPVAPPVLVAQSSRLSITTRPVTSISRPTSTPSSPISRRCLSDGGPEKRAGAGKDWPLVRHS